MRARHRRPFGDVRSRVVRKHGEPRALWKIAVLASALLVFFSFLWLGASLYYLYGETYQPIIDDPDNGGAPIIPQPKPGERINVLILGLDNTNGPRRYINTRSDTMMVVSIDPMLNKLGLLSIPRDTRVPIPGRPEPEKIGHAHAYGGPSLSIRTVADFLGVPIHYYLRVDYTGFINLVDIIGPVEITVDREMFYEDPDQDLYIDIKPGTHRMDGQMALKYVRWRSDSDADIGRIARQQHFLNVLMRQSLQLGTVFRLPQILSEIESNVQHSVPGSVIANLLLMAPRLSPEDVKMGFVPGDHGWVDATSFWIADAEATRLLVDEILIGIDREANAELVVEIIDATGTAGRAQVIARQLEAWGYNVKLGEPATEAQDRTQVITALRDNTPGKVLARSLDMLLSSENGVELFRRMGEPDGPDITIILGTDFGG